MTRMIVLNLDPATVTSAAVTRDDPFAFTRRTRRMVGRLMSKEDILPADTQGMTMTMTMRAITSP